MTSSQTGMPIVLIGGGGHASVLADILTSQNREICAVVSPDDVSTRQVFENIPVLTSDKEIAQFSPQSVMLVNGIGMLPFSGLRCDVTKWYTSMGYRFETVVSEQSLVSKYAVLEEGGQVFPGAIVQAGAVVGKQTIVNTGAIVEHDCLIGPFNHLAPGCVVCGGVKTGKQVFIGANATVTQGSCLGDQSIVGAGAMLSEDLSAKAVCYSSRSVIKPHTEK
ncbi:acetyltransferase [Photobacterium rosenbergii]|uniref:acetyltransferase n=1 Tax=Photobacterium rosenbergii TaxID=294936 RepID=UPI0021BD6A8A|nr:acetyltransferase [Photobacterium rosenbergii]